jgi:hypothetical protein
VEEVEKRLKAEIDKAFQEMLDIAKTAIPKAAANFITIPKETNTLSKTSYSITPRKSIS